MKYYIGEILEVNGGMEYESKFLFSTDENPEEYCKKIAMEWRGSNEDDFDENYDAFWADNTLIYSQGSTEIPKEDFEVLKKYMTAF